MITIQTADNALKSFYLDAVTEALDMKANPLLAKIQRSTANVVGKDVKKLVKYGVNGGISAGSETGSLPPSAETDKLQFTSTLKNLYGTIEISDKALRASAGSEGAFVNLLNDEMQSLVKSASFNFGRMLYGDGSGKLAMVVNKSGDTVMVDDVSGIFEGMLIDFTMGPEEPNTNAQGRTVLAVDRENKMVKVSGDNISNWVTSTDCIYAHDSKGYEITGLKAIFSDKALYGVDRADLGVMKPYIKAEVGEIDELTIQTALDKIEENAGSSVNFIVCSWGVRRALLKALRERSIATDTTVLEGGFKAISFNGIPVVADRFCPAGTMYLLNTDDFVLHQLCDWQWLEGEDGKILKQIPGKPVYTATLVKYAELMCNNPSGQGMLTGITEA